MGISGDFFVVTMTITHSQPLAIGLACVAFAGFVALWFGYTLYRRQQRHLPAPHPHSTLAASR